MCRCSWHTDVFPCIIQTRLARPDTEGEGEEDISRVHDVGVSHVVHLLSPLHVPCWVPAHQRGLCLSIDVGSKKCLEQVRLFNSSDSMNNASHPKYALTWSIAKSLCSFIAFLNKLRNVRVSFPQFLGSQGILPRLLSCT